MIGNDFLTYLGCCFSTAVSLDIIKVYVMIAYMPYSYFFYEENKND